VLALVALTCVVYCNSLLNGFTMDDEFVYSENYWISQFRNLPHLFDRSYFQYSNEASYRPLCTLTYFVDAALWSTWPGGPHLTNLLLYIGTVLIVFFFIRRITRSAWAALFGAALFSIHPIHTEVVNNISFREDLLIGLLLPGSWLLYRRGEDGRAWLWTPLALLVYLLATMSKENAIMFPLLVVLLELAETEADLKSLFQPRRLLFLAGLAVVTIFYLLLRFRWMRFAGEANLPQLGGSIFFSMLAAVKIHAYYLLLFFCPYQLRALYPASMYTPQFDTAFLVSFSALLLLLAFLLYFRKERFFVLGVFWWLFSLLPVSNLQPIFNPMAERYLFLPSIGFCLWIGWLVANAFEQGRRVVLLGGAVVLALILSVLTFVRNPDWRDNQRLWLAEAEMDPANPRVLANLAAAYYNAGEYDRAIDHANRALALTGQSRETISPAAIHLCLASAHFMQGKVDEALLHAELTEKAMPARFDIDFAGYRTLGMIYDAKDNLQKALAYYRRAAEINPFRAELWRKLAFCELRLGMREQAQADWEKARALDRHVPKFEEVETLYQETKQRRLY
jgi:tetratricopeptide (TPR) repeat protein